MLDTLSRIVFLMGGIAASILFILFGLFFWVGSTRGMEMAGNRWSQCKFW